MRRRKEKYLTTRYAWQVPEPSNPHIRRQIPDKRHQTQDKKSTSYKPIISIRRRKEKYLTTRYAWQVPEPSNPQIRRQIPDIRHKTKKINVL